MTPSRVIRLFIMLAVALAASISLADEEPPDDRGFVIHDIESARQSGPTKIRVLLPDRLDKGKQYRVLYILPVEAQEEHRYGDGLRECKKASIHNRHNVICVAPTFSELPWYADHPSNARMAQESYFIQDVLPLVERTYCVVPGRDGRLLIGFSKSGWGAFSLLLRHPDVFAKAAAWDAPLMMDRPGKYGSGKIFATRANFEAYRVSALLAKRARELGPTPRLIHFGYSNFQGDHQEAHALMNRLGIPHIFRDGPRRSHDWHSGWLRESAELLVRGAPAAEGD